MTNDEIKLPKARPRPKGIGFLPETKSLAVGGPVGCANALVTASLNFKPRTSRYEASWGTVAGCGAIMGIEAWRMKLLSDNFVRGREARSMPWLDSGREGGVGGVGVVERKKVGFLRTFIVKFQKLKISSFKFMSKPRTQIMSENRPGFGSVGAIIPWINEPRS